MACVLHSIEKHRQLFLRIEEARGDSYRGRNIHFHTSKRRKTMIFLPFLVGWGSLPLIVVWIA